MMTQKILYTDGHEVTVTDSLFIVKKSFYQLNGITKHSFFIIHPDRLTPFLTLLLGAMMITLGAFQLIPLKSIPSLRVYSINVGPNTIAFVLGIIIFTVGSLVLGLMKDRYAIRIVTAEGEKNVVVSRKKEYINQILDALNHAFLDLVSPTRLQLKRVERK